MLMPHLDSEQLSIDLRTVKMQPPATALVVDNFTSGVLPCVATLMAVGFHVTTADTFQRARAALNLDAPLLLVTDLTLGEYNGLHLVLRAKAARPDIRAVVLSRVHDPVLQTDTEQIGATFVPRPFRDGELMAAIFRTLCRAPGRFEPIRAPFERRGGQRRTERPAGVWTPPERRTSERRESVVIHLARI